MREADVDWLLTQPPLSELDPSVFPKATPLRGILRNECRIRRFQPGEVILREGDYGNTAFLMLSGSATVALSGLPADSLGRQKVKRHSLWSAVLQPLRCSKFPEARAPEQVRAPEGSIAQSHSGEAALFLQDFAGVLEQARTFQVLPGEMFGEVAAMYRTPRTATVVATAQLAVLEIRWQGLRLLHRDPRLGRQLDDNYRKNWLHVHLRETPIFRFLPEEDLAAVAASIQMRSFGRMEWHADYRRASRLPPAEQIETEPVVATEGNAATELVLLRSGFARVCRRYGEGWQTVAYLGKGQLFGLSEMARNWLHPSRPPVPLQQSLRAVGSLDTLHIPVEIVAQHILPHVRRSELPDLSRSRSASASLPADQSAAGVSTGLLEFLVQHRFNNGRQAMVIDLDRCTRCDDCVRACATTHDGNPRFVRSGPSYGRLQFAHACMHCSDPVCMIGCPTGAISRESATGTVSMHEGICIGCGTCAAACPYQNIRMVEIASSDGLPVVDALSGKQISKATKCDLCQSQPAGPACQNACPHDALVRIDLGNLEEVGRWIQRHPAT